MKTQTIWFTGLPCSGKTTIANALLKKMKAAYNVVTLDGDDIRATLNADLGFTTEDRIENIRRVAHLCQLFNDKDISVLATFVSPTEEIRKIFKDIIKHLKIVFVDCPLDVCIKRDVKGMYKKALDGIIPNFTGISAPFEEPHKADLTVYTNEMDLDSCVNKVLDIFG
jgi:adenylylsulfate kinase